MTDKSGSECGGAVKPIFDWEKGRNVRPNALVPSNCEHDHYQNCIPCMWGELYRLRDERVGLVKVLEGCQQLLAVLIAPKNNPGVSTLHLWAQATELESKLRTQLKEISRER